jgi:cytidylate kinase
VATLVARRLGWRLLDSGALYRLLALAVERKGLAHEDLDSVCALARGLDPRFEPDAASVAPARVFWGDRDVSRDLRAEAIARLASRLAAVTEVRDALLECQRKFRLAPGLVADGRDMGTVVFPEADVKVFLTATAEERARRRHKQLKELGMGANLGCILQDLVERDTRDIQRATAPLRPASDASIVDTTGLGVEAVVDHVMALARQRVGRKG